jgi:hypothetical protein
LGTEDLMRSARAIAVKDTFLYIASNILEVNNDRMSVDTVAHTAFIGNAYTYCSAIIRDTVLIQSGFRSIVVCDVTYPASPIHIAHYYYSDTQIHFLGSTMKDSLLYIITSNIPGDSIGVLVFDIDYSSGNCELQTLPESYGMSIYPNPFNSALSIESSQPTMLEIHDIKGNLIHHSQSYATRHLWQPDKVLPSGLYLIKTTDTAGNINIKKTAYLK